VIFTCAVGSCDGMKGHSCRIINKTESKCYQVWIICIVNEQHKINLKDVILLFELGMKYCVCKMWCTPS